MKAQHQEDMSVFIKKNAILFSLVWLTAAIACAGTDYEVPDFPQTYQHRLPKGGAQYCAPVAVSNSFMWLSRHGYPQLAAYPGNDSEVQLSIIQELASSQLMNTSPAKGTSVHGLMRGIKQYVQSHGYQIRDLAYQGWRLKSSDFHANRMTPEPVWALESLQMGQTGGVWLNIGWYKRDPGSQILRRISGHWVTVVSGTDNSAEITLHIHDPSPRAGLTPSAQTIRFLPMTGSQLIEKNRAAPLDGATVYQITGDLKKKKKADAAILEGIVVLRLQPA